MEEIQHISGDVRKRKRKRKRSKHCELREDIANEHNLGFIANSPGLTELEPNDQHLQQCGIPREAESVSEQTLNFHEQPLRRPAFKPKKIEKVFGSFRCTSREKKSARSKKQKYFIEQGRVVRGQRPSSKGQNTYESLHAPLTSTVMGSLETQGILQTEDHAECASVNAPTRSKTSEGKPEPMPSAAQISCGLCPEFFNSERELSKHLVTEHNVKPSFVDLKQNWRMLKRGVANEATFKCKHCPKTYFTSHSLKRHLQEKHAELFKDQKGTAHENKENMPYVRKLKDNTLTERVFETIVQRETDGYLYACKLCHGKFRILSYFKQHLQRVHLTEPTHDEIERHKVKVENDSKQSLGNKAIFKCSSCKNGQLFSPDAASKHLQLFHDFDDQSHEKLGSTQAQIRDHPNRPHTSELGSSGHLRVAANQPGTSIRKSIARSGPDTSGYLNAATSTPASSRYMDLATSELGASFNRTKKPMGFSKTHSIPAGRCTRCNRRFRHYAAFKRHKKTCSGP